MQQRTDKFSLQIFWKILFISKFTYIIDTVPNDNLGLGYYKLIYYLFIMIGFINIINVITFYILVINLRINFKNGRNNIVCVINLIHIKFNIFNLIWS